MLRYSDVFAGMQVLSKASTFGLLTVMAGGIVALEPINDVRAMGLAGMLHLVTTQAGRNPITRAMYLAEGIRYGLTTTDEQSRPTVRLVGKERVSKWEARRS